MKKYLLLFVVAGQLFAAKAQSNDDRVPYITKSLSSDAVQAVEVRTQGGSILVKGGAGADARVEVYVWGNNSNDNLTKEEIQHRLDEDYTLTVSVSNHQLTAIAKPKHEIFNWRRSLNISFRIYVPENVATDLETSGGSITLGDLAGTEKFSTSGGSLHIDHLTGKTTGSTSGGSIHVTDSKDIIDLSTSGGSIEATNCTGNIRLSTSGGSLHLLNLNGTIHAETSGGSAEGDNIEGDLFVHTSGSSIRLTNLACSLDAETSGAGIHVAMAKLGKFIKLGTSGGNIDLEIPNGQGVNLDIDAGRIKTASLTNFSGSQEKGRMNGTLNGGGIPVRLNTSGGAVSLTTR
jgi:hypothetical protein